jgi:hypothetical protein
MPIDYLRTLKHDELPYPETDASNIDKLRALRAAGMVDVELPDLDEQRPVARVIAVTGLGCATLRVHAVPPRSRHHRPFARALSVLMATAD